jgi:hypothetical protein
MPNTRRELLLAALTAQWSSAVAQAQQHAHGSAPAVTAPYTFRLFTPEEQATVKRFAAVLIPPSPRSGGAAVAGVEQYIDFILSHGTASLKDQWRAGLAIWAKAKNEDKLMRPLAAAEFQPRTPQQIFFTLFKAAITDAFYTSEEGITKELGYQGMGFLNEFRGYDGEELKTPAQYKPLLRQRS